MLLLLVVTFLLAILTTALLIPLVIRLSWTLEILDRPGMRKVHKDPIPRLGGIAIFAGFILSLTGGILFSGYHLFPLARVDYHWFGFLGAAILIVLCGIVDDIRGLSAPPKFIMQFAAATVCYYSGFRITALSNPFDGGINIGWLCFPVTLLWIVGVTNSVNMIDGLDGLAGGVSLIVTCTVVAISLIRGEYASTVLCVALAGTLIGFLKYNFYPARVFMGDTGSMFLGFTLSVAALRASQKSATAIAIVVPVLALGLPVLDTLLVTVRRLFLLLTKDTLNEGRGSPSSRFTRVFSADREHVHHNLMELGVSHQWAVLILYCLCVLFALASFSLLAWNSRLVAGTMAVLSAGGVVAIKGMVLSRRRARGQLRLLLQGTSPQEASGADSLLHHG